MFSTFPSKLRVITNVGSCLNFPKVEIYSISGVFLKRTFRNRNVRRCLNPSVDSFTNLKPPLKRVTFPCTFHKPFSMETGKMSALSEVESWSNAAISLVKDAGKLVRNAIGQRNKSVEVKASYADLVTETDKNVEKLLIDGLRKQFPDHKFIGEESVSEGAKCDLTDDPTWIIDPVDGTMNFVHGLPFVAISVGLAFQKEVILGIVYIPVVDKMFTAIKSRGAYCNGDRIKVSGQTELSKSIVCMEVGSSRDSIVLNQVTTNYANLAPQVHGIRSLGSAAINMCHVASGGVDAYYEYSIHCWDIAAGKVIVEEAGGVVLDPEGGPLDLLSRRVLCASNIELALSLSSTLKHIKLPRD